MQAAPVEPGVLGARLRQQQLIEDPRHGEREPLELEACSVLWPHPAQWALIELLEVTDSGARRLEEYRFTPVRAAAHVPAFYGGGLPVAVLFERTPNGASRARLYSTPALRSIHPRSLAPDMHLMPGRDAADAVTRLARAAHETNLDEAAALFEPQAAVQAGDGAVRRGPQEIRAGLERLMPHGRATVRYCTRLDEAARSALEILLPGERPALVVCQRGAPGLLAALRWYG
jgi:hypothetical protein